jgi:initiation factor 1A
LAENGQLSEIIVIITSTPCDCIIKCNLSFRAQVFKEDGQEYGQVTKMLGNGRLEAMCFDGVKRLCHIRGKLRKKVWINQSDIILVSGHSS